MSIEINAPEVFALADLLRSSSGDAEAITGSLSGAPPIGGGLQSAVECFLESHRTAAHALAGELQWLGGAFATVADSWLLLDARLLALGDRAPVT